MSHKFRQRFFSMFLLIGLVMSGVSPVVAASTSTTHDVKATSTSNPLTPTVILPVKSDLSPDLRTITPAQTKPANETALPLYQLPKAISANSTGTHDASAVQTTMGPEAMPTPLQSFDGLPNLFGGWPPDTQGDIGPNYYVQWINLSFAIWAIDKVNNTHTMVFGPAAGNTLFTGFGGPCESTNDGDVITLYDPLADRWLMSQFALPTYPVGPFYQCIAVSKTGDPTGAYWRYQYTWQGNKMNDYPKFGVWPDAYYMTANQFASGSGTWAGAGVAAFNRAKMMAGNPTAEVVFFDLYGVNSNFGGMLPADFDGKTPPPAGAPGLFAEWDDSTFLGDPTDMLRVWQFHVDWATPANSTFGLSGLPNYLIPTTNVDPDMCGYARACIPQPGTSAKLDAISDRLMYRLQYRNFGSYQTLVSNHTVDATGTDIAGVHWFELQNNGAGWIMGQEGVYHPDSNNRWMGSAALDHVGNLALGYSVSSSSVYPSVRYAGRLVGDPAGQLSQGEASLVVGSGSQTDTSYSRWGDYSMLGVDPSDDCTFWYTQEYVAVTGVTSWTTRIGSFKIPSCSLGATGALHGTVTDAITTLGIADASIQATLSPTQTFATTTISDGTYGLTLPVGAYGVTASAYGYVPSSVSDVNIYSGTTTIKNFALAPAEIVTVDGYVTDVNTDWPLYAKITIDGYPGDPIWTNPVTGYYSIDLVSGQTYTFHVEAWVAGYLPHSEDVLVNATMTKDFALDVDAETCSAPGYRPDFTYYENFESGNGGFTASGTNNSWQWGIPTSGPGVAHSGQNVWATNLSGNYNISEDGYITSPAINLSSQAGKSILVSWWQWLQTESGYDYASVQASKDGGVSWSTIYPAVSGSIDLAWTKHIAVLDPSFAVSNFKMRFHFTSDSSVVYPGWYVDDIGIGGLNVPPPTVVFTQDFEPSNGGFTHSGTPDDWQWGTPTTAFPTGCGSGIHCWGTNLAGNYAPNANETLLSPVIDLSGVVLPPGSVLSFTWSQAYHIESATYDHGYAEVSINGGAWQTMWQHTGGTAVVDWADKSFDISTAAGGNVQFRFRLTSDSSVQYEGLYIDNLRISYAAPVVPAVACVPQAGGLVVGNVFDANTLSPLVGANVSNDSGESTTTVANPNDLGQAPAFYTLFSPSGLHDFTGAMNGYGDQVISVDVVGNDTVGQNFHLPAGLLTYAPPKLDVFLLMGTTKPVTLTLTNSGGSPASWELKELDKGMVPVGPFQEPTYGTKPFKQGFPNTSELNPPAPPEAAPFAAGDVIQSWPTGIFAWGITDDPNDSTLWLSSPSTGWGGNDTLYEYTTGGTQTGRTYPQTLPHTNGPGDMAYNQNTGMMWIMNINTGVSNCIFEINPASGYTGNSICPGGSTGFTTSQRGLAYDPSTDTFFAGGWNDLMVYRFTTDGTIIAQVNTGLSIAGLAYNPDTQHLFVIDSYTPTSVYVLDVANNYAVIGQFAINGFSDGGGAGLEMGCNGHLWAVDQTSQMVYEVDSSETTSMCTQDVPWLSESPITGTLSADSNQPVRVTFDASVPEINQPGKYLAQLMIKNDTPYAVPNVPVTMTVEAPASWGKLDGTVNGLGYCDTDPAPLADANVLIEGADGYTANLVTNESGFYSQWLNETHNPLTVTVTAPEHSSGLATGVMVSAGVTTTQNFNLRWLEPCVSVNPTSFEVTVAQGYSVTTTLNIINSGAAASDFALSELPGTPIAQSRPVETAGTPAVITIGDNSFTSNPRPATGVSNQGILPPRRVNSTTITESVSQSIISGNSVSCNNGVGHTDNDYLRVFDLAAFGIDTNFSISSVDIGIELASGATGSQPAEIRLYTLNGPLLWANMTLIASAPVTVPDQSLTIINMPVAGTIPAGSQLVVDFFTPDGTGVGNLLFVGSNNLGQTAPTYLAAADCGVAEPTDTAAIGFPDMHLVMNVTGDVGSSDVPWLSELPVSGTVGADSTFDVEVSFDSMTYTLGTYTATLVLKDADPVVSRIDIPVTMHIVAPTAPVVSFTSDSPVNVGNPIVFTNTSDPGEPPATEFVWDFGDGITKTVSTADPVVHLFGTFGTFTVSLTACNVVDCDTVTHQVVVLPKVFYLPFVNKN